MKNLELKILESMKVLVSEGQSIAAGNNDDFSEFASENGYDLELVEEVYSENEEELTEIWKDNQ